MPEPEPEQVVWRKSRRSNPTQDCVEVAAGGGSVRLRDSKNPAGPILVFPFTTWQAFVSLARGGELDAYRRNGRTVRLGRLTGPRG